MAPVHPLLWRSLRVFQVYGANTDVGKTVFTTVLCRAANHIWGKEQTTFLKPVSTGPEDEADDRHIQKYAPGVDRSTLLQYDLAISPHAAAKGKFAPPDKELLSKIYQFASRKATRGPGWLFIETAGGVHSPGPSGTTQADLYTALRCPVVLIGDSKLGGISLTISAFESLKLRGYDVESILVFQDGEYDNEKYLRDYFAAHGIPVVSLPKPPSRVYSGDTDAKAMLQYYEKEGESVAAQNVLDHLDRKHQTRIERLESMSGEAYKRIWYPFTQHKHISQDSIAVIDSARGDFFQTLVPSIKGENGKKDPILQPSFDGSASWWTQGLGHGNPSLTMAAAYAAGRYGHVMFAGAVHEPALALAETLLSGIENPRLTRVFFSDNGSTGVEVAVKMALRAARLRYDWAASDDIGIIGLKGGYHGDTIGAMDCAEPSTYNENIEWYNGKGIWFDYPNIKCVHGQWVVEVPNTLSADLGDNLVFTSLSDVFDIDSRESRGEHKVYEDYIEKVLARHRRNGRKFGALLMEPVVIGAGGMQLVDPLFQRALVNVVRRSANLFGSSSESNNLDPTSWTGLPVIFDEVFTGLYRLGRFTASSFLKSDADISVHAKLLTGGLVPLSTTLASDSIFKIFESDDKADALLHGHSYTAHPIGCQVALESVRQMQAMEKQDEWGWAKDSEWSGSLSNQSSATKSEVWSIWPWDLLDWISNQTQLVAGTWALGSILAIHMSAADGLGYKSNAALKLQRVLLEGDKEAAWNVHSRVLGNVLYLMGSQKSTKDDIAGISSMIRRALTAH
ncbi:bifunctional dethiobiotin synthetase/adenosylmethionine-8-amino-7-oxononanoate aminotransferase [Annulohypoxylon maeteangense]|uniref:bifunctional dethiobiotin synthetase/adenosylmethionine-8-amino-7-oxononanoate aminotransferase n=1 Tax=Annulohypoxylon maeteangense TaxID=1927788 RepID=UPI0020072A76|nr:bifunctional dethiobiotin synthetase/adenosylmethionine-8-amino-7-oxononanoate aminotransferase [Annulohypoxylon maeteangense]KAI0888244.1 bifunctional dethiobiotin synthetase/adenosylmethionine-8-amino-7-oxononanoate aminotransferase [Annulohypoxylon maeteangense]